MQMVPSKLRSGLKLGMRASIASEAMLKLKLKSKETRKSCSSRMHCSRLVVSPYDCIVVSDQRG